jgi:hypothetical protein
LVVLQLLVFVTYLFGPTATFAEDPTPEPTPTESVAPEPTLEVTPEPTAEPTAEVTPEPIAEPTPESTPGPTVAPTPTPPGEQVPYLVTFFLGTSGATQVAALDAVGATNVDAIPQLAIRSVLLDANSLGDQLDALRANPAVVRVEADRTRDVGAAPSDASYADQWSLPHIGWEELYGSVSIAGSATVAILDTGVDASHPDLDGVVLPGWSALPGVDPTSDPNGHGTWMAGIVGAETGNGYGVAGTAYAGVSVLPITVLGADGTGQDSDIIAGVVHAADAGADVILMAFSNPGYSTALQAAIDYAWGSGAVLVAATGNDGASTATFPAGDRGVIGVTSSDAADAVAPSANRGPAAFMAAPGVAILTTASFDPATAQPGDEVVSISGTSAAAASVAGAAALLVANEPELSNGIVVSRLARTADAAGDPADTGNGRLNLLRAMADTSTEAIQPAGAAPVGAGGPLVGPYVVAARQYEFDKTSVSANEGNAGTSTFSFPVSGQGTGNTRPHLISWTTSNLTATGGAACGPTGVDYVSASGVLSFATGENGVKNIVITVCGDTAFEPNETFLVTLTAASPDVGQGANIGQDDEATGTIVNDDAAGHDAGTLSIDKTGPATAAHGATITYTMDVSYAPGADGSPAQNIVVSDDQCSGPVSAPDKSITVDADNDADAFLEADETWRYACTYAVPAVHADGEEDPILNTASASGQDLDGDAVTGDTDGHSVNVTHTPGTLTVSKSADADGDGNFDESSGEDSFDVHGGSVTYRYLITYTPGTDGSPAQAIAVSDDTCSPVNPTLSGGFNVGDLDSDGRLDGTETWTYTCAFTVPVHSDTEADPLVNTVTVSGQDLDGEAVTGDDDTYSLDIEHDAGSLTVSKSVDADGDGNYDESNGEDAADVHGGSVTYRYRVTYAPGADGSPARNIVVSDDICSPVNPVLDGIFNEGDADDDNRLDASETWVYRCTFTVPAHDDDEADPLVNTATVAGTDVDGNDVAGDDDTASLDIEHDAGDLTITKAVDADGDALFDEANGDDGHAVHGDTISYRFQVTYDSDDNVAARNVTMADADCTTALSGPSGDTDTDGRLDEGETWTHGCAFTVPAHAAGEDDPITNTATADGDDFDGDELVQASSNTTSVDIWHAPAVTVTGDGTVDESGTTQQEYTFTVTDADPGDTFTIATGYPTCGTSTDRVLVTGSLTTNASGGTFKCTFPDGHSPATSENVSIQVIDGTGLSSTVAHQPVTVNNVAPTVTFSAANDTSVDEGSTHTYEFSIFDPGDDGITGVTVGCGGAEAAANITFDDDSGSFDCTFPDGPATQVVSARATDTDGATGDPGTQSVTVNNVAPSVVISGPASVNEGQTLRTYSFDTTDPGADTFTAGTPDCGTGAFVGPITFSAATGDGSFDCRFADDDPTGTDSDLTAVSISITDDDTGVGSDTYDVTVNNVEPVATDSDATYNPVTGDISASVSYTDDGTLDGETGTFKYTWIRTSATGTPSGSETQTATGTAGSGTAHNVKHLDPGCYNVTIEMFVTDDDTGVSNTLTETLSNVDLLQAAWRPPIKDNERNIAKYGNVVPLKVELKSLCSPGQNVTSHDLFVTIAKGNFAPDADPDDPNVLVESVSNADTGTQMRIADSMYIYNLTTKSLQKDTDYTVRVRLGSSSGPIIVKALFTPKK